MSSRSKKENDEINPLEIMRTVIEQPRFSHIFEDDSTDDDHFIYAKNNILIILLCFTVYSIHHLFKDYLDTILIAVLSGVAYRQLRDKFIKLWVKSPFSQPNPLKSSTFKKVLHIILFCLLPWVRRQSKKSFGEINFTAPAALETFVMTTNPIVRLAQTYLLITIIYDFFGDKLDGWFKVQILQQKNKNILKAIFAFITSILLILVVGSVVVVFVVQIGRANSFAKKSIENIYECSFQAKAGSNTTLCTQKISGNLSLYMPKIMNETELTECIQKINSTVISYLGSDYFDYEDSLCTALQYAKYISPNLIESVSLKETGQVLGALKSAIFKFINFFLDLSFSLSTFFAIFLVTIKYFEVSGQYIYIFGSTKKSLVQNIANIISATVFIAMEHLALGITVFEIFRFTEINMILSIFLSIIAFIPLVKPIMVVALIAAFQIWYTGYYIAPTICTIIYWYFSGVIYEKYYAKVDLHIVLINLSVIFGIYQYGVTGIFYGPILILLLQCVYEQLFRGKQKR